MPPVNSPTAATVFRPGDAVRFKPQWTRDIGLEADLTPLRGEIIRVTQTKDWEVARVRWAGGYNGHPETSALTRNLQRLEDDQWLP